MSADVLPSGQFELNGHDATLGNLAVDGGAVDLGGATLTANNISATTFGPAGTVNGGVLHLSGTASMVTVSTLYPDYPYQAAADGLIISSQITSPIR